MLYITKDWQLFLFAYVQSGAVAGIVARLLFTITFPDALLYWAEPGGPRHVTHGAMANPLQLVY